ncbi:MAG: hypothetical protein K2X82_22035 [Gemmataceae bacterium]|nr:hypothetical protein [Gemmataceae bacterium]
MRGVVLFALTVGPAGCGADKPKLVPVSGTASVEGRALVGGSLTFHPPAGVTFNGDRPSCQLQADGSFVVKTYPHGDGAPPGAYKVTLSPELASRIKRPQLADPAKTTLAVDVPDDGKWDVVLDIK